MTDQIIEINLDALAAKPAGRITFDKTKHDVLPADATVAEVLLKIAEAKKNRPAGDAPGPELLADTRKIVKLCVPSLSDEQVERLSMQQQTVIVALATNQLDRVREIIGELEKNVDAPEIPISAPATPPPSTGQ